MEGTMVYKCPCCGGTLVWSSKKQKMVCEYCDNVFTEEQLKDIQETEESEAAESEMNWKEYDTSAANQLDNMKVHICQACGGEIVGDENSAATECVYCGSPTIITENISGVNRPDYVIPFKLDKKKAKEALKEFYKGKRLLPNSFKAENRIEKITGVYVPFWLFDCEASASITYDATKTKVWSDSKYDYTRTDFYRVIREGSLGFEKIPADGSSKMDDGYMDSLEPFDYKEMEEFSTKYLPGYFADKYDVDSKASIPRVNERVKNSTQKRMGKTVKGYNSVTVRNMNVKVENGDVKYTMFPVWMLNTNYKGKLYTFAMNGQTGRLVGELPVDKGKFWKYLIGISAAVFTAAQLIVFLI